MSYDTESEFFIFQVQSRKPLYDRSMPEYSNKNAVDKLWDEVAQEVKKSVPECKQKWTVLRNSYARSIRDMKVSTVTGSKKKKWYLADAMSFLADHMQYRGSSGNSTSEDCNNSHVKDDVDEPEFSPHNTVPVVCYEEQLEVKRPRAFQTGENPDELFFKSLLSDMSTLSGKRRRKFKQFILSKLNELMDEQDSELFSSHSRISFSVVRSPTPSL